MQGGPSELLGLRDGVPRNIVANGLRAELL
jgi:hypothetical protein